MTEAMLQEGCQQRWPESQTLDFKRELPAPGSRGVHEFLKDVCAFANADGGDLVYGVAERNGVADAITPITNFTPDEVSRRLTQVLDAGIEPRLSGITMHSVAMAAGGFVWVVRVPSSFDAPHRYRHDGHTRFVVRNGTLASDMTYDQIRTAFDRSATLVERARQFRKDRVIGSISQGLTWRPLVPGPLAVVHLMPLAAMSGRSVVDVGALHDGNFLAFAGPGGPETSRTISIDGLLVHPVPRHEGDGRIRSYSHVFRTCCLEAVRHAGHEQLGNGVVPDARVAGYMRQMVPRFAAGAMQLGFMGPAIVGVSLVRLNGARLGGGNPADRGDLLVPEGWIGALDGFTDVDAVVRPMLDTLWQCFDQSRCPYYDEAGNWHTR
jgi:hypothetical protein